MGYVVTENWAHIFDDRRGEELVRFVYDSGSNAIVAMDFRSSVNRPWRPATPGEVADVLEEIDTTGNLDCALMDGEAEETDAVPDWAAGRVQPAAPRTP